MKEFLVYTAARLAVFTVCVVLAFALFWGIGGGEEVPVLLPLLVGAVVSVLVSAWLLRGLRDRFVAKVQARAERSMAARRAAEAPDQSAPPGSAQQ